MAETIFQIHRTQVFVPSVQFCCAMYCFRKNKTVVCFRFLIQLELILQCITYIFPSLQLHVCRYNHCITELVPVPQIVFCCNFLIHPYPLHYSTLCPSDPSENSHKTTSFRVNTKNQKVPFHKRVHYICKYIYSCDYIIIYHIIHIPYDTPRYLRQPFLLQP